MKLITKDTTNKQDIKIENIKCSQCCRGRILVGIGASAGGLESFELFFKKFTIDTEWLLLLSSIWILRMRVYCLN
jgi:chemotaxis response regulator CheB